MIRTSGTRLQVNPRLLPRLSLHGSHHRDFECSLRRQHTNSNAVDDWCIPIQLKPPAPQRSPASLSDEALIRLHRLSALEPPEERSSEFEKVKNSLQAMLAMVDSVKDFEPTAEDLKTKNGYEIPDGRIWPTDESLPIDWEALVQKQEDFIRSRQINIPGSTKPNVGSGHSSETGSSKADSTGEGVTLEMATEDIHTVRRRGLGQQPQNENIFYVAKLPGSKRSKSKN
ncbi:hypothetical protein PGT21_033219 [Puccinia graminis f. sp. tritici]|uniref:Uncharacterized protein n=1 Tax=Puccinia graminis f. sp. tritici TaxID=56615 RepID=A0A5B0PDB2_PUCGR|nr:hypothetical protein PGT21_033219 [Puccinia graminis f. sp. tritici]KAA1125590.1 hypothetical protein PGTUg99_001618 [Puccinia graminis f. sp. tritici]